MASNYAIRAAKEIRDAISGWADRTDQFAQIIDAAFGPVLDDNEHAVEKMMDVQRARLVAEQDAQRLRAAVVALGDTCRETLEDDLAWVSSDSKTRLKAAVELAKTVLEHGAVVPERTAT